MISSQFISRVTLRRDIVDFLANPERMLRVLLDEAPGGESEPA
ncbi:hypothetical protein [Cupriavidus sp. CuC1]|nr:hypothetical protein [Cupriavidus sp. CV2]MDW3684821.1 hypothetical protein [Cupriavidus sp. CV2]